MPNCLPPEAKQMFSGYATDLSLLERDNVLRCRHEAVDSHAGTLFARRLSLWWPPLIRKPLRTQPRRMQTRICHGGAPCLAIRRIGFYRIDYASELASDD